MCQSGKEDKICVKKEMHFNFFCPGFGLISCVLDCLISCVLVCSKCFVGKILVFVGHLLISFLVEVWFWCGFWGWDGGGVDVGGKTHQKEE